MEFRDLGIRQFCDISGKHENRSYQDQCLNSENNIGHPDEIEKKKHFIGQADSHGLTQTLAFGCLRLEVRGE